MDTGGCSSLSCVALNCGSSVGCIKGQRCLYSWFVHGLVTTCSPFNSIRFSYSYCVMGYLGSFRGAGLMYQHSWSRRSSLRFP